MDAAELATQALGLAPLATSLVGPHLASLNDTDSNKCELSTQEGKEEDTSLLLSNYSNNKESGANDQKGKDFCLLATETQELKIKTRKLQLEIDEKNEIINILKDELETTKEQNDKFQRDNLQLLKDSKNVRFLQDENDFLQDKMGTVENKLELEQKRLKEKLAETEFLKLRNKELEDDKSRAQEESAEFEDKWQKAKLKLKRVTELETELDKWKSFSNKLELENTSIQGKLFESIEQEAKLNSTNKQVEDEVKRLRLMVKSYEERHDEEQATNSLSQQQSNQSIQDESINIKFEIDQQLEKELDKENRILKQKLNEQEIELKEISIELESNKRLISDLRQDLACEKSLASKLTKQLATFTKQIKNLDKQYFPIHDISQAGIAKKHFTSTLVNQSTPITDHPNDEAKLDHLEVAATGDTATTAIRCHNPEKSDAIVESKAKQQSLANSPCSDLGSLDVPNQEQQLVSDSTKSVASLVAPPLVASPASAAKPSDKISLSEDLESRSATGREDVSDSALVSDSVKLERSRSSKMRNNFVRNSLPSRSVNFGHSKSSAYLDRIRASVTATTTTNTTSSFNERSRNVVLSTQPVQSSSLNDRYNHNGNQPQQHHHVLNCMLDHQHGARCFVNNSHQASHLHASQQPVSANHDGHSAIIRPILQSSRQLNALIDPASNEQLMMSLLHQNRNEALPQHNLHRSSVNAAQRGAYMPLDVGGLTDQQIATNIALHHQHYYHHLQHMHQLHQLHHQHHMHVHHHRMHHRYQQQQSASGGQTVTGPQLDGCSSASNANKAQPKPIYSGSQFYPPSTQFDQIYSSMTANSNIGSQLSDQHKTRLVGSTSQMQNAEPDGLRASPSNSRSTARIGPHKTQTQQQQALSGHYAILPQIDEVNGLPTIESLATAHQAHRGSPSMQHRSAQVVATSETIAKAASKQHNGVCSNGSPPSSSSSPTSSASSNLSSSSASSSSSLNSLSTSSAPLNRSALRHTTTELNRRQFSIERELDVGALPLAATLSRVGSCRVNRSTQGEMAATQSLCNQHNNYMNNNNNTSPQVKDSTKMRTPVKSQQPSMRTSKILNISQQSSPQLPLAHQQQQQLSNQLGNWKTATNATQATSGAEVDKIASNLANIRLNDSLTFTSLRAPRNCSGASSLKKNRSSLSNNNMAKAQTATNASTKVLTSLSKPSSEKNKLTDRQPPSDNGVGNSGKSSVWFEYGCV